MVISLVGIHTICGMRGHGKSYYVKNFIIPSIIGKRKIIVWDINHEYPNSDKYERIRPEPVTFIKGKPYDYAQLLNHYCKIWYHDKEYHGSVIIIEEADVSIPSSQVMSFVRRYPWTYTMLNRSRHVQIGLFLISRFPSAMFNQCYRLSESITIFRLWSPLDIDHFKKYLPEGWPDKIREMRKRWFIFYNDLGEVKMCPPIKTR